MIRVLLVEDHELVRDALAALFQKSADIEVVGSVASVREAVALLPILDPDIVLADLSLADGSAMEILRVVEQAGGRSRVIVLTGFGDQFPAVEALAGGAAGYLLKSQSAAELLEALRAVARGKVYVAPEVKAKMPAPLRGAEAARIRHRQGLGALTRREREIFLRIVEGDGVREIAQRLGISPKTVETHRSRIQRKLAVRTAADVVRFAIAHRIVDGGGERAEAPAAPERTISTTR